MGDQERGSRVRVGYQITPEHAGRLPALADRLAAVLGLPSLSLNDAVMMAMDVLETWVEQQEAKAGERIANRAAEIAELPPPEAPVAGRPGRPRKTPTADEPAPAPKKRGRPRKVRESEGGA